MNLIPNLVIIGVSYFDGMASSTRVRNLLNPLVKKKLVTISNIIYEKDARNLKLKNGNIDNVHYQVIGFRKTNPFSFLLFFLKGILFLSRQKDSSKKNIIYIYDHPHIKNILFILYGKLIGYKIVIDIIEDNRFYTEFPRFITKINNRLSLIFIKYARFYSNSIIAISEHLFNRMSKITKNKIPVHFIPISVDLTNFKIRPYYIPHEFKIFYGGSFSKKDGIENLIRSFEKINQQFSNVSLILTGRGIPDDMKPLHEIINNSSLKSKIIFKGYLETEKYYKLMNECDIYCMTRVNSEFANAGFPFKLGEFLATGKAVVATNVGDVNKYIFNNVNALLINPESVQELTDSIISLIQAPLRIETLGMEARKTAETYFDSENISSKLYSIFSNL